MTIDNPSVVEGDPFLILVPRVLTFTVTPGGCTALPAQVSVQARDTSIPQDNDFADTDVTLSWAAGNADRKTVAVRVNPDVDAERDEDLPLHICRSTALVQPLGGLGTILNDDGNPHWLIPGDTDFVCH